MFYNNLLPVVLCTVVVVIGTESVSAEAALDIVIADAGHNWSTTCMTWVLDGRILITRLFTEKCLKQMCLINIFTIEVLHFIIKRYLHKNFLLQLDTYIITVVSFSICVMTLTVIVSHTLVENMLCILKCFLG